MEKLDLLEIEKFKANAELESVGVESFSEIEDGEYIAKINNIKTFDSTKTINGIETIDTKIRLGIDIYCKKTGNQLRSNYGVIASKYGKDHYQKYVIDGIINLSMLTIDEMTKELQISPDAAAYRKSVEVLTKEENDGDRTKHFVYLSKDAYTQIENGINLIIMGIAAQNKKGFAFLNIKTKTTTAANGNTYENKTFNFKIPGTQKTLLNI